MVIRNYMAGHSGAMRTEKMGLTKAGIAFGNFHRHLAHFHPPASPVLLGNDGNWALNEQRFALPSREGDGVNRSIVGSTRRRLFGCHRGGGRALGGNFGRFYSYRPCIGHRSRPTVAGCGHPTASTFRTAFRPRSRGGPCARAGGRDVPPRLRRPQGRCWPRRPRGARRHPGRRAGAADVPVHASPALRRAGRSRPVCLPAPPGGGRAGGGGLWAPTGGPHLHRPHAPSMDGMGGGRRRQHRSQRRRRPAQGPLCAGDGWAAGLSGAPVRGRLGLRQRDPLGRSARQPRPA